MTIADEVDTLLQQAHGRGDQDIFFQGIAQGWLVFGRRGQERHFMTQLDLSPGRAILNYFKYQAQMDLSEQRRPQIGAWHYRTEQLELDLRLASVGDFRHQETLVIRLLAQIPTKYQFINSQRFTTLTHLLDQRGLILFSGPTGSGKTTLMYYLAQKLAVEQTILTIEDPPEMVAPDFIQLQVNSQALMSYQSLLQISLRLRPDVLIIGEIRDELSAQMAAQAALSGHLVLATVHARTSGGVIQRLHELQLSQATLRTCLTACCYQRLLPLTSQQQSADKQSPIKLAVHLDLLFGATLATTIAQPAQSLQNWRADLQTAQQDGLISSETFQKFQYG
ncbi:competence type IV pilus ATPase ComGA [Lapidilactobacillus wuchangensis]|uniref:competence type IV pilus ATPase ComGA n=1 Tax=Lapidilactobacillus wuchangensis TaxID=2486001 RepID=UPI000F7A90AD|nr:competence type IV pilus ATPase ComGA [Lapidilactobacillus wuchangensis]